MTSGLSAVGSPPVTSNSHEPAKLKTADAVPYSRYGVAPSTPWYQAADAARSSTTKMCVISMPSVGNSVKRSAPELGAFPDLSPRMIELRGGGWNQ